MVKNLLYYTNEKKNLLIMKRAGFFNIFCISFINIYFFLSFIHSKKSPCHYSFILIKIKGDIFRHLLQRTITKLELN